MSNILRIQVDKPVLVTESVNLLDNPCFSEQAVRAVREACSELMKELRLQVFEFARVFDDGSAIILYSDPAVSRFIVENKIHVTAHVSESMLAPQFWYIPSKEGPYLSLLRELKEIGKTGGFLNFIQRFNGYFDMFCFLPEADMDAAVNLFINSKEKAESFAFSIRDRLGPTIVQLSRTRMKLPAEMLPNFKGLSSKELPKTYDIRVRGEKLRRDLDVLLAQTNRIQLTPREKDCLALISQGQTSKDIAEILSLSPRTVEAYTQTLKGKLCCVRKSELMDRLELIVGNR